MHLPAVWTCTSILCDEDPLALAVCGLRGSMLQAATRSINEGLKPLWETVAQASDIKVGIDVLKHLLLDPTRVLRRCLLPARRGGRPQ